MNITIEFLSALTREQLIHLALELYKNAESSRRVAEAYAEAYQKFEHKMFGVSSPSENSRSISEVFEELSSEFGDELNLGGEDPVVFQRKLRNGHY